jgi:predicted Rossmann fold flavoprotein
LPKRLWYYLLEKNKLPPDKPWIELGNKSLNRLVNSLTNDTYQVSGKTTFKEEFVTCGGVSLKSINPNTMESKVTPGIFFAGEVLDIDGITGGYNFQAAWTTAHIAGQLGA